MSYKTRKNKKRLRKLVQQAVYCLVGAVELVLIDLVYGKSRYRKRAPRPRPIVQKTVIYRQGAPRVVLVEKQR